MLLAAGLGTRLRPLTEERPKALVPIGDRVALFHTLDRIHTAKCERIAINAHHLADAIVAAAPADLRVSVERDLLGTAGGIERARKEFGLGDLLVCSTDIFGDFDLAALAAAHRDCIASLLVSPRARNTGNIGISADGCVVRLRSSSFGEEARGGDFVVMHVVSEALELPERGCIVGDVYIPALARGRTIRAVFTEAPFVDIGTVSGYLAANRMWLSGKSFVGARASVECALEESVVGEDARVTGSGSLVRSVVWPGASATAPLANAVVTPLRVVKE